MKIIKTRKWLCYFSIIIVVLGAILGWKLLKTKYVYKNINSYAKQYLENLNIKEFYFVQKRDYDLKTINIENSTIIVTDKEIEEYINTDLESSGYFIEIQDRDIVKEGDFVTVDYQIYLDNELVNQGKQETLKVGADYFSEEFEKALLGAKIDENYTTTIKVPISDNNKQYAGKTEQVNILVTSIKYKYVPKLNDEFVRKNYDLYTVADYYDYVKKKLTENKKNQKIVDEKKRQIMELLDAFDVEINYEELSNYAISKYEDYKKMAEEMSMDLEEFVNQILGTSMEEFYDNCFDEVEQELKKIIVVGVIAKKEGIDVSSGEMEEYMKENEISKQELENEFAQAALNYKVLEEKVLVYLTSL